MSDVQQDLPYVDMDGAKTFFGGQCEVTVIEHSRSVISSKDIVTYQLKYPRFIHPEVMTHRVFSRNAGSSRAIPTEKLFNQVMNEPAFFVHVGENQPGMQANAQVSIEVRDQFYEEWKELAAINAKFAKRWATDYNIHKQCANRVLEPFLYISVVLTATEFDNWNELRDHDDAQPEIHDLAATMKRAIAESRPRLVTARHVQDPRGWHLPYVSMEERRSGASMGDLLAMSAARCARVSYLTHDKQNPKAEDDVKLYRRLVESRPLHASPLEHQAAVSAVNEPNRNLRGGWVQHRTLLETAGSLDKFTHVINHKV